MFRGGPYQPQLNIARSAVGVDQAAVRAERHAVYRRIPPVKVFLYRYIGSAADLKPLITRAVFSLTAREGGLTKLAVHLQKKDRKGTSHQPRPRKERVKYLRRQAADDIVAVVNRAPHQPVADGAAYKIGFSARLFYPRKQFSLCHGGNKKAAVSGGLRFALLIHYLFFFIRKHRVYLLDEGVSLVLRLLLELL